MYWLSIRRVSFSSLKRLNQDLQILLYLGMSLFLQPRLKRFDELIIVGGLTLSVVRFEVYNIAVVLAQTSRGDGLLAEMQPGFPAPA